MTSMSADLPVEPDEMMRRMIWRLRL